MDRAEATGLGVAVVGHVALLAALTLGLFAASTPPLVSDAISVSFVDDVALVSASPTPAAEPPAQATAPEAGPPEEAAPAAPSELAPAPPTPRTAAPAPERARQPQPKADPTDRRRPEEARGRSQRSRAPGLGDLNLDNIGRDPSPSRSQSPPAATMSAQAAADIGQAIARQVQPCADRQVYPGPGSERIATRITLRLNRNGSLAARPVVGSQTGLDDENRRYAQRVADIAIAAFTGCSPLRGLPQELYDVPRGWSNFTMIYRLPS